MIKHTRLSTGLLLNCMMFTGCVSNVWTGATLLYDRHSVYKKFSDFQLNANANRALYQDLVFKRDDVAIDVAVFNGDILLAGHVPTLALRDEAVFRVTKQGGYRRFHNALSIEASSNHSLKDVWITMKIRSGIFADDQIKPDQFKIITSDQVVYIMGDVIPLQALKVINIAQHCSGVRKVVKLLKYYNLSDYPDINQIEN
ncbi:MAG: BON domain-containing protein [Legionella sp.]